MQTPGVSTPYHQAVAPRVGCPRQTQIQNIPIRNAEGRRIRQAFVAPAKKVIMASDYSQIELRIMAHLSGAGRTRHLKIRTSIGRQLRKYLIVRWMR